MAQSKDPARAIWLELEDVLDAHRRAGVPEAAIRAAIDLAARSSRAIEIAAGRRRGRGWNAH